MNIHETLLRQMDPLLENWRQANQQAPRPRKGWIRTIRKALGMTIAQLANRLGLDPSRVVKVETAELTDSITLKTLRKIANAMECELVYAVVPKKSLKYVLENRARNIIKNRMNRVSHSMALEDQAVSKAQEKEQIEELIKFVLSKPRMLSSLWNESEIEAFEHKKRLRTSLRKPKGI